jgi:alpha-galactosidase
MSTLASHPTASRPRDLTADPLVIAFIGAGSVGFTRGLLKDLLGVPELAATKFRFHDISPRNLAMVADLCRRDITANHLPATVTDTTDQAEAVRGADYIITTFRVGGLEAFRGDIDIPLKYGIDQCVGDTICAGGIMYHQRNAPVFLKLCADIKAHARPTAMLLNYANPMAMNTWLCNTYGGVPTIGLCHGVQGAHWQIADCIRRWAVDQGLLQADDKLHRREVDVVAAGLNHQTWFLKASWRGKDFIPLLPELFAQHPEYQKTEKVRIDVLKRFGYYSTESNGHLSEYLPWYRKRPEEIARWIDTSSWIHGETGGYLRVCTEGRSWFEHDYPTWLAEKPPVFGQDNRGEEHGSYIIESLTTGRPYRGHFNVINRGHITNLPDGCVVEIPGWVDRNGLSTPVVGDLPLGCAATCSASVRVQQMSVEAAHRGDANLLKLAMLHDPLVGAVCSPEEVWQLADEMLVAQAEWLPQYAAEIPRAKARLAAHDAAGTRVALRATAGAVRIHTKSVDEMALEKDKHRANAAASDKGQLTKSAH